MNSIAQPALAQPTLTQKSLPFLVGVFTLSVLMLNSNFAFADANCNAVKGLFDNIIATLGLISVAVVTIAILFAGYQIAFAHKRISDVAPVLIGGVLIGAAGQIANIMLKSKTGACTSVTSSILDSAMQLLA